MNGPFIWEISDEWSIHRSRTELSIRAKGTIQMKHPPGAGPLGCPARVSGRAVIRPGRHRAGPSSGPAVIARPSSHPAVIGAGPSSGPGRIGAGCHRRAVIGAGRHRARLSSAGPSSAVAGLRPPGPAPACPRPAALASAGPLAGPRCSGLSQFGRPAPSSKLVPRFTSLANIGARYV
jgi:hypothetical protein